MSSAFRPGSGCKATRTLPAAPDGVNVLQAMWTGGTPVKTTLIGALVIAAMQRHAPHMLTAHKRAISVSTSWMHQFLDQKLNWLFRTSKPKASQKKTAKAASNEGASLTSRELD
eukprot:366526-Chlamydomonas_euryale.AAC.7